MTCRGEFHPFSLMPNVQYTLDRVLLVGLSEIRQQVSKKQRGK